MKHKEIRDKILAGLKLSFERLVEKAAAFENKELVIADFNGNPKWIKAKKLLKQLKIK